MDYRAIAFDTGGTVLDWHSSMLAEVRHAFHMDGLSEGGTMAGHRA